VVAQLVAAAEQEDFAAALGKRGDRVVHRRAELTPAVEIFRRVRGGRLFTAGALDPGGDDVPVAQVFEGSVARRHMQVRAVEAQLVAWSASVPEMQKQILDQVFRRIRRPNEPEDVLA